MLKKPLFYFFLGLLFLIAGILIQGFSGKYFLSQEYYVKIVEENIEQELRNLEYEMMPVLDTVSTMSIIQFSDFDLEHKYPYFIFRNEELKLWSGYHYVPSYLQISGDFTVKVIASKNNRFLARKWQFNSSGGKYEVVSLIPISSDYDVHNQYLSKSLNRDIFNDQDISLSIAEVQNNMPVVIRGQNSLWMSRSLNFSLVYSPFNISLFILYLTGILLLFLGGYLWLTRFSSNNRKLAFAGVILIVWFLLKLLLNLESTRRLISIELFDPQFFSVSWFEQSFADMLLNTLMIFFLILITFRNFSPLKTDIVKSYSARLVAAVAIVFILNLVINYQYLQLRTIYFNSQISLDITQSLTFSEFRILSLLVFLLISASTALLFHLLFIQLSSFMVSQKDRLSSLLIGSVLFWLFTTMVNLPTANLLIVTFIIIIILFYTGIQRSFNQLTNSLTLYILFWIIIESLIAGWCITEFEQTRQTNKMVKYAQSLASKNDYLAEFMIRDLMNSIKLDPSISARLSNPFLSKEFIGKKITNGYLNSYLDRYTSSIYLYSRSGEGIPGFGTTINYFDIKKRYRSDEHKTEFDNLYLLSQEIRSLSKHYMAFIPIDRYGNTIGYIILDFKQKRLTPENVYPELLVDNRFFDYQLNDFNYAIFESNFLIQSSGNLDYTFFNGDHSFQENPWINDGYKHYLMKDNKGDTIIVSQEYNNWQQSISNSTFLMTILIMPIIFILIIILLNQLYRKKQVSYIVKIQLFLNLAFFIPITMVTVTTLSFITVSFKQEQLEGKLADSERLVSQIHRETDAYIIDVNEKGLLTEKLIQLASYGHFDANVYGIDGKLITTTQPGIFSTGLQSVYLNPQVLVKLMENHEEKSVEDESIGGLTYYATYSVIRSPETNRILGVLSIPFFQAKSSIEHNQIEALTTILNMFILIFIVALIATSQTSKWLTSPLLMIREKLGQTSFSSVNKPIHYNADDEIGNLIAAYNSMITKLESSKDALSRSQKESAWREVAQQVAHEIKNPLTPMKLTLQKLEKAVSDGNGVENLTTTVKSLLNQLQILNDIVSSFSEFAKMPIPKNERMDLAITLNELKQHFSSDKIINLQLQLHAAEVFILSDKKLMSRILSNIILNAGQSKKEGQSKVEVNISTKNVDDGANIQIIIQDNGSGMDKDVVDRVFIPRFTTKKDGSGIGLAVAKHGIENVGGSIWFETEAGRGTIFYLQLPQTE